ncbi:hypothetical protein [Enterovibrio nigricans]|uniref:Uncharacterized protein n=1 Tax=Enterovibrio nigricans DSM 22720 TaxID=1121868 RepID=A0A1T4ULZ2_9GAMM|nr:hypothetical protein [Enterovibrio nigricans]SKA53715.1 hypothetical protein SAMN02745132_02012 [Enterovibrio nigricans DSM 22720]
MTLQSDPLPTLSQEPGAATVPEAVADYPLDKYETQGDSNGQKLDGLEAIADNEQSQNRRDNEELADLPK